MTRSVLDALRQPGFATQQPLLTSRKFIEEADDRGVRLDEATLEILHREAILVPLFAVKYDPRELQKIDPAASPDEVRRFLDWTPIEGAELRKRLKDGTLDDAASTRWVPYRSLTGSNSSRAYERVVFVYSPYQLLQLRSVQNILPAVRWVGRTSRKRVSTNPFALQQAQTAGARNRDLLPALHAAETIYRPLVMENIRGTALSGSADPFELWEKLRKDFDASKLLKWTGWSPGRLLKVAEGLIQEGWWNDPLRDWDDLVALVRPQRWLRLRGDALIAIDRKIAAEVLLRFYEDLVELGKAPALPPLGMTKAPRHSRLTRDRSTLQEVLTLYDVSPHPSVVLVLEGASELEVMPKVLDELSSSWRPYIELLDAEGASKALDPLMAFAAQPRVLREAKEGVLVRPPVRVVVVMDPEGNYVTAADRVRRQRAWINRIVRSLPRPYRTAKTRDQLRDVVTVVTWNRSGDAFEFANWTDRQIANAILAQPGSPNIPLSNLARSVGRVRARHGNLESLWKSGWPSPRPKKPAIAATLWPSLARRVSTDRSRESARVPAVRVARLAISTARRSPRYMIHILKP